MQKSTLQQQHCTRISTISNFMLAYKPKQQKAPGLVQAYALASPSPGQFWQMLCA